MLIAVVPPHDAILLPASTVGTGLTVTNWLVLAVQPALLVAVTVYVVLEAGFTVMAAVVAPVLQA
jgi:hypothetical protein